jgi:hypothetical protein
MTMKCFKLGLVAGLCVLASNASLAGVTWNFDSETVDSSPASYQIDSSPDSPIDGSSSLAVAQPSGVTSSIESSGPSPQGGNYLQLSASSSAIIGATLNFTIIANGAVESIL